MLERILSRFRTEEEIELTPGSADQAFRERKDEELGEIEHRIEDIRKGVQAELEEVLDYLEELEDYEDSKDRAVMNDVVENVARDRRKMIEELSLGKEARELEAALEEFIQEFSSLSQKEAAVMEEAFLLKEVSSRMEGIEAWKDELEKFLENRYTVKESALELEKLVEERERLKEELENTGEKLEKIDTRAAEEKVDMKERELQELRESQDWEDYQELQDRLEKKRSELADRKKSLKAEMSNMERGLKKLLYNASKTGFGEENLEILESIRDGRKDAVMETPPRKVKAAASKVLESGKPGDLEEAAWERLVKAAEKLEEMPSHMEEIRGLEEEIEELEEDLENHAAAESRDRITGEKDELEEELETRRERKEELGNQAREIEERLERNREEIRGELENHFSKVELQD